MIVENLANSARTSSCDPVGFFALLGSVTIRDTSFWLRR
jgi:hypothetical protein